ncbi:nucleotide sugar dehydrogenase [Kibdelosporangium philippinense]|uniref:Nucleotide sugar dehydrogenase n=1 Tax=Kibdelosporangium philippinense TaxID=211113 RepID=A0ABS8ZKB5_9PSEU|nr:nucleotide sugar dehydrogenase [Kibdelosporangium philippinense]MCE7006903.1 nucleotide sugar dehydrogenase [Kibdelosporangium philippinense]
MTLGRQRVVVVGQGYVGLPLSLSAAQSGHTVIGYDVDEGKVKRLSAGESFTDNVSTDLLRQMLGLGRYTPTTKSDDCAEFDVAVLAVPTPLQDGVPDISLLRTATREVAGHLRPGATVIVESTTYPGTTADIIAPILQDGSGLVAGSDFHLGFSPERIDPGNRVWTLTNTPKIVSGIDPASLKAVQSFYETVVDRTVPVSTTQVAELAKLLENTFRHVNIALVNELAMLSHRMGIPIWETIDAAATKPFGFMAFQPGPGVGGHCLPVDPTYLSWHVERTLGLPFRFIELANGINSRMPEYVAWRIQKGLSERGKPIDGARIILLGLAYKKNIGDTRESPAVPLAELLTANGAQVWCSDPHVAAPPHMMSTTSQLHPTATELAEADAVVLVTDHDLFDLEMIQQEAQFVLDCRNRLTGAAVEAL